MKRSEFVVTAVREDRQRGGRSSYDGAQNYSRSGRGSSASNGSSSSPRAVVVKRTNSSPNKKTILLPVENGNHAVAMVYQEVSGRAVIEPVILSIFEHVNTEFHTVTSPAVNSQPCACLCAARAAGDVRGEAGAAAAAHAGHTGGHEGDRVSDERGRDGTGVLPRQVPGGRRQPLRLAAPLRRSLPLQDCPLGAQSARLRQCFGSVLSVQFTVVVENPVMLYV